MTNDASHTDRIEELVRKDPLMLFVVVFVVIVHYLLHPQELLPRPSLALAAPRLVPLGADAAAEAADLLGQGVAHAWADAQGHES